MTLPKLPAIVIIGDSPSFIYLLQRYADRIGYSIAVTAPPSSLESAEVIRRLEPIAVILASVEILEASQSLVAELANRDIPVIVCSSEADQIRIRELGADYCLLHPVTFGDFQNALTIATAAKRV